MCIMTSNHFFSSDSVLSFRIYPCYFSYACYIATSNPVDIVASTYI